MTDRLVTAMLTRPGTPTLRMSANSSQRGVTPRKLRRTGDRPERRYQIQPTLPTATGSTSPHAAPAGPNAGIGPAPKISNGASGIWATPQPPRTDEDSRSVPGPARAV